MINKSIIKFFYIVIKVSNTRAWSVERRESLKLRINPYLLKRLLSGWLFLSYLYISL
jgi:hypothetical protein